MKEEFTLMTLDQMGRKPTRVPTAVEDALANILDLRGGAEHEAVVRALTDYAVATGAFRVSARTIAEHLERAGFKISAASILKWRNTNISTEGE